MKLYHSDATSCSVDGVVYRAGPDGSFDVPESAAAELVGSHGFKREAPKAEPPPKKPKG